MKRALFLFRRDLRLEDNTGLNAALQSAEEVVPAFIFDPRQCKPHPYLSKFGLQFLIESLEELSDSLAARGGKLFLFFGEAEAVVRELVARRVIDGVFFNRDYTPFSQKRDRAIAEVCREGGIPCHSFLDALLFEPGTIVKDDGSPYTVYSPFAKRAFKNEIPAPSSALHGGRFSTSAIEGERSAEIFAEILPMRSSDRACPGGRSHALGVLNSLGRFAQYDEQRNLPGVQGTTELSPHHKFGTVSPRESVARVAAQFSREHTINREILWREFFSHVSFFHPHVYQGAFQRKYDQLEWNTSEEEFKQWCEGRTGFPIVDAGMRQLVQTGMMHNRVRMICGSFLVKNLHISWRWGERFFAQYLVDYDPAVNNGNWQWVASTGCDAAPYFRVFNPWLQQQRFDPECVYIKRWVPELESFSPKQIHSLEEKPLLTKYPRPCLSHKTTSMQAQLMFSEIQEQART